MFIYFYIFYFFSCIFFLADQNILHLHKNFYYTRITITKIMKNNNKKIKNFTI